MTKTINTSSVVSILLHKTLVGGGHLFQGKFFKILANRKCAYIFQRGCLFEGLAPIQRFKVLTYFSRIKHFIEGIKFIFYETTAASE